MNSTVERVAQIRLSAGQRVSPIATILSIKNVIEFSTVLMVRTRSAALGAVIIRFFAPLVPDVIHLKSAVMVFQSVMIIQMRGTVPLTYVRQSAEAFSVGTVDVFVPFG